MKPVVIEGTYRDLQAWDPPPLSYEIKPLGYYDGPIDIGKFDTAVVGWDRCERVTEPQLRPESFRRLVELKRALDPDVRVVDYLVYHEKDTRFDGFKRNVGPFLKHWLPIVMGVLGAVVLGLLVTTGTILAAALAADPVLVVVLERDGEYVHVEIDRWLN